jgi:hypothetical protein
MESRLALVSLAAVTWFMTGLIWFVQIVHYPLFAQVDPEQFLRYVQLHRRLTSIVVVAPMVLQIVTALYVAVGSSREDARLLWVNFGLVLIIWMATAACSIPSHNRLCLGGFDAATIDWLVKTNWVRTIAWSICSVILMAVLFKDLLKTGAGPTT